MENELIEGLVRLGLGRLSVDEQAQFLEEKRRFERRFGLSGKPGRPAPAYFAAWAKIRAEADRRIALSANNDQNY